MENAQREKSPQEIAGIASMAQENPAPVLRLSADAKILYYNPAVDKLLGELGVGEKAIFSILPPGLVGLIDRALKTNSQVSGLEVGVLGRVYSYSIVPLIKEKYVNLYANDVTERHAAAQKLRSALEEWSMIFDAMPDLVFIQDENYTVIKANKAFFERFNLKAENVIGKKCFEVMHKLNAPWRGCTFEKVKKERKTFAHEVNDPNLGAYFLMCISPILNDKGDFFGALHIAKDITAIKKTEKELKVKIKDLEIFHKAAVDRELKMIELKKRIGELERKSGYKT